MSAKWRALQHRHRYTYSAVVFPHHYTDALHQSLLDTTSTSAFHASLEHLISLNSTFAQIDHVKKLASAFAHLLTSSDESSVSLAARFYLQILFLENSLPLHKTLVSPLAKTRNFQSVTSSCFRSLCEEFGDRQGKGIRFCLSRAALSMMSSPKLGYLVEIVEECAILVAWDVVVGLNGVISETNDWCQPSPIVMEQCQEALSCVYYLLQRFPSKFSNVNSSRDGLVSEGSDVLEMIVTTILNILKSPAFSRDCFVSAGVSFCAALQVCLNAEELGLVIMEGIVHKTSLFSPRSGILDVIKKIPYEGDFLSDVHNISVLSRLCLIRGILTAVPRTVLNTHFVSRDDFDDVAAHGDSRSSIHTILYDGILPELCKYCENPTDSHFNFHTLTVMQICLQQIKTSIQANVVDPPENYDLVSEDMGARILRIIWNNLEDPLSQTVKQVHLIFDLFLDIQSSLHWADGNERIRLFLRKIASDLLRLGPRCKGRYVPLASLSKRLGAKTILDMSPDLLFETTWAYIDDDVCCAATTFLKCFLECLRDECWNSDGVESGCIVYRGHCLRPFLYGLASGISKLRSNLNTYAVPVLLEVDMDSIYPMLGFVSVMQGGDGTELVFPELNGADTALRVEQQVSVLVSLLKVSRLLALIEGDIDWCENSLVTQDEIGLRLKKTDCYALVCVRGIKVKVLIKWLVLALTHTDDLLRIDAAESLFLNPKTSSLPSSLELSLLKEAVPLNMRCSSTAFQMKFSSLFRKFFSRVRTALERHVKQGGWQPLASRENNEMCPFRGTKETVAVRAEDLFQFMKWLSCFLFFSCYPSAPYERKIMAMELILIMNNAWSIVPPALGKCDSATSEIVLSPYSEGYTLPDSTLLLVGSIVDSWDRLRESSFHILLHFPTPLPGISSPDMVRELMIWAKKLVCSPRVRESDAGALTLRLIFRKYVLELGCIVRTSCNAVYFLPLSEPVNENRQDFTSSSPAIEFVKSLIDWLHNAVEEGEKDLSKACKNSFVHGVLLALRYTVEELDWDSNVVLCSMAEMKRALEKLLELLMRITSLALWVVSADALSLPEDMDDMVDEDSFLLEDSVEKDVLVDASEHEAKSSQIMRDVRPSEQIVMVGCWLAMKEVSLLLGTIIRKIPLSTLDIANLKGPFSDSADVMLELKQLETIGNHFLEVLLKMKHNGAIDKTRAGFTALCNRLLCSNDPRLGKLTESWMEQLMERTVAKGQTVDDLLRRSAEPEGTPKRLLPRALRWLIDVAKRSIIDQTEANITESERCSGLSTRRNQITLSSSEMVANGRISKVRDEGVIPTVHAFNVLRATFNDANLATDTSGFAAEALIISIRSFSSSFWEIRNSACLAYTALVRRMIGFLNVQKRESARRALTGLEFFHRYLSLHPFLFNELKVATQLLRTNEHQRSNLANVVHPSLCPMLILLSRLKPSTISSEAGDAVDPILFMPFIRKCSTQSNLRVRVLASRALTGLISNVKLQNVLPSIAAELPCSSGGTNHVSSNTVHGILLQLSCLLDINCRNLADYSKKDQVLSDVIQVLVTRSWIGSPRLCPCPILNGCFLKVLDIMLSIARTCLLSNSVGSIWKSLWNLSSECLDVEASHGPSFYDPTLAELRKQAAVSYFNCVFQASKEESEVDFLYPKACSSPVPKFSKVSDMNIGDCGFRQRLLLSMSDTSYEVRIVTLKWLLLFLKATALGIEYGDPSYCELSMTKWTNETLQENLMKLLVLEKNHRCSHYILKILFTWNLLKFKGSSGQQNPETRYLGNIDVNLVVQFWDKLVFLYKLTTHAKTRETLVCCMGICVKRFAGLYSSSVGSEVGKKAAVDISQSNQNGRLPHLYGCISYYVTLIKQHSEASEPVNMRKAAAESMVASGLLEQVEVVGSSVFNNHMPSESLCDHFEENEAVNVYARRLLDIWLTCIKLLEDEDEGIRRRLGTDVQKCFTSQKTGKEIGDGVVPSQVDKVIILSFDHLSSILGHWLDYFDYLSRWVLSAANSIVARGDLVRRVFDKEIDNHHEEKLLITQLCCSHLEKLPNLETWAAGFCDKHGSHNFLHEWRMRFYQQLISFSNDHIGKQGGLGWFGGVGNHKDAFLPLYANLLGFYALSNCILRGELENSKSMLSDVVKLGEIISPFLRNPLILNLYLLVVKSHERMLGANLGHSIHNSGDVLLWDGFDPYFLLR
ncbi:hypothetical protein RJ639_030218 [Escallonia herrerae]|uniref:DUF2428 domain-containing protein n=1 Tax=Escallonia herrerae TaxID=1293975 RepID=A0AA88X108_9ASTE|nr:hypothetical protein RJ639_030218 [Escallonia herrerae]